jgi:thioredoxin
MSIQHVDEAAFAALSRTGTCVVEFGAKWCGPCKLIAPRLASIKSKVPPDIKFLGVDIDECRKLVRAMNLRKVPTVVIMKAGVEVGRHEGLASEANLLELVQRHI